MPYQHRWYNDTTIDWPVGKVVCVGRNYVAHARELNNPVPSQPLLFMKPATSVVALDAPLLLPSGTGPVHYETELAILIGKPLTRANGTQAKEAIAGVGLALDLTLRDLQTQLKADGHPWERAKAFDGACPLSSFVPVSDFGDIAGAGFSLTIDGELRQKGNTADMITPVLPLIIHISETFTLRPGDVVLTGTPAGVGALESGQKLLLSLDGGLEVETSVQ
ncbi:2-keto-4-pentenoate hydratase/2-oxohepta-3-ene-1,7-dioic acid hydratase (catechol pathway) [Marinobacter daqiaonensis]|uniref:2-keto-4-pentenoate hydratase/2-oxohepta-3-ene-1,7-dioic acid hydratase (Catechol pathway) n=1 Tax=Marinobacter daqiaonensis TaxID=650891 RepID=A0A1I6HEM8_9GAMM|nr:fumarylacetoacetate hydrolase family protein [Marinobacter daqiaonensis]SFR52831.1 2-keto-4-pentenoate hydratase/2-oxohepta-3-ene-1,7-dioic acid hydratase (catechol pathway) [Marinobacter daqiaonensis]